MSAVGRQAACLESLSDCPSVVSSPATELVPLAPTLWLMHHITDTRTLRSATLGSTLPLWPHLQQVDGFTRAETTPSCAHPKPTTPAALCVASGCVSAAGTGGNPLAWRPAVPAVSPQVPRRRANAPIRRLCRTPQRTCCSLLCQVTPFLYGPHNGCAHAIESLLEYPTIQPRSAVCFHPTPELQSALRRRGDTAALLITFSHHCPELVCLFVCLFVWIKPELLYFAPCVWREVITPGNGCTRSQAMWCRN